MDIQVPQDCNLTFESQIYINAIHYSVRDEGVIRKLVPYVILGINASGMK